MLEKGALKIPTPKIIITNFPYSYFSADLVSDVASYMLAVGTALIYTEFRRESM